VLKIRKSNLNSFSTQGEVRRAYMARNIFPVLRTFYVFFSNNLSVKLPTIAACRKERAEVGYRLSHPNTAAWGEMSTYSALAARVRRHYW